MLRSLLILLSAALVSCTNAAPLVESFGEWTLVCPPSRHCFVVLDAVFDRNPHHSVHTTLQLSQEKLKISFALSPDGKAPEQDIYVQGTQTASGPLTPHCSEKECVAVWEIAEREMKEFLSNRVLLLRFDTKTTFLLPMKGLDQALAKLKERSK